VAEFRNFEFEFVRRTVGLVRALSDPDQWKSVGDGEDRAVTLLLNCMQGTVIYLQQAVIENSGKRRGRQGRGDPMAGPAVTKEQQKELRERLTVWPKHLNPEHCNGALDIGEDGAGVLSSPLLLMDFLRNAISHADLEATGEAGVVTTVTFVAGGRNSQKLRVAVEWLRCFVCYLGETWIELDSQPSG
jgi:hypothetical protein